MKKCYSYENDEYELFVEDKLFIKEKQSNRYLINSLDTLTKELTQKLIPYEPKISSRQFTGLILYLVGLFLWNLWLMLQVDSTVTLNEISSVFFPFYLVFISYTVFNVLIHELGHIKTLNVFGRKHNKIGFKMNYYIFPSVYVGIDDIYMISKQEKILVHSAGLFINYSFINLLELGNRLFWHSDVLHASFFLVSYSLLWNVIPLLNSDGYKILTTCLSSYETKDKMKNSLLVKGIQLISLGIVVWTLIGWIVR